MHWLIDAGAIKTGGGVQIALNRLPLLIEALLNKGYQLTVLLPSTGPLSSLKLDTRIGLLYSPDNWLARIFFEYLQLPLWMKTRNIKGIYSVFGFGLPHPVSTLSIVSTANATTCYPDSPYWKKLKGINYLKRKLYTHLRQSRLKLADYWVFETELMRQRSVKHLNIPLDKTCAINPSPTIFLIDRPAKHYEPSGKIQITLLTGNEQHKNIEYLIDICCILHHDNIQFNISLTKEQLESVAPKAKYLHNINCLGKIPPDQLQSIYDTTDILMNLSELESFSNNYMEAWKAGLAQICSDRDFARYICGESAFYIEPLDPIESAKKIRNIISQPSELNKMATNGKYLLDRLTRPEEYIAKTLDIIRSSSRTEKTKGTAKQFYIPYNKN